MTEARLTDFSHSDISFLLETVDPRLVAKIDTIKGDDTIISSANLLRQYET